MRDEGLMDVHQFIVELEQLVPAGIGQDCSDSTVQLESETLK
jgi:hypothetical protein